jgi:hypothetical protein
LFSFALAVIWMHFSALNGFIAKQRRSSAWRAGLNRCPTDVEEKICVLVAAELEQYKLVIQKGPDLTGGGHDRRTDFETQVKLCFFTLIDIFQEQTKRCSSYAITSAYFEAD